MNLNFHFGWNFVKCYLGQMNKLYFLLFLLTGSLMAQNDAESILKKSIQYHDPEGVWSSLQATFFYKDSRPDGSEREASFRLDNANRKWTLNRSDEEIYEIEHDEAKVLKGDKDAARGVMLRNYYLYLWGLPMKLQDESTPEITQAEDEEIEGQKVDVLRVAYEKETYYFSFDQQFGRMLQYRFYKDEEAGIGEVIKLNGEVDFNGLKIPKERSWYTLPEMKYLGTDILERIE